MFLLQFLPAGCPNRPLEKVSVIIALKETLSKLKGKAVVDKAITLHPIDPELLKIDVSPLAPKLRNNRTAHTDYLRHTQEETATLREIVESERLLNPLNSSLDYALPLREPIPIESNTDKLVVTLVYSRKSKAAKKKVPVSNPKINKSLKFLGTVKFGNDHVAKIMGYGDYKIGNVMILRVYFVEGLGHNLFSVRQFCDSDMEVAFRQHTCFIRNLDGVDLLTGSRGNNLYTLSLKDMMASSPIALLFKASKTNVDPQAPEVIVLIDEVIPPVQADSTSSPSSTTVDQDTPSLKKDTIIIKLKQRIKSLSGNLKQERIKRELEEIETINIKLDHRVTKLVTENEHLKQTYKQLHDSIKSSCVRSKEQCDALIKQVNIKSAKNSNLNASLQEIFLVITALKDTLSKLKGKAVVNEAVTLLPIDPELLKIDVAPLAPKLRNNRTAHYDYLKHTQEETATLREIVENERLLNPLNTSLDYACKYTKRIEELLIILKQAYPCINDLCTKLMAVTLVNNNKKIRFTEHIPSSGNTPIKTTSSTNIVSNKPVLSSTGVTLLTSASGSQPQGNTKKYRIQQTQSRAKNNNLEDHPRNVRPSLHNKKSVVNTKAISSVPNSKLNVNSDLKCATCNGCLFYDNHDSCVLEFINSVNAHVKSKSVKKPVNRKIWQPIGKVFTTIGHKWKPTRRTFTLVGNVCPLTRITTTAIVPLRKPIPLEINTSNPVVTLVYSWKSNEAKKTVPFCDSDLKVAFCQHTCFIHNLDGVDLLTGSRGNNLYTLSLGDMMASSPICLLSKASKTKSWLWHRHLSHLNFGAINHLAKQGLVRGLPKLKFEKRPSLFCMCNGKIKKKSRKPKSKDINQEKLFLLHVDLCGPMRVEIINGKKYILVIVDDYSRFTWVKCLRSKDEAPYFIIKFLKMIQFGISHETSVARSPKQNSIVERRNRTLIEAARTMLIYAQALLFLWAEAVATACYTQNRSIIRLRQGKTPYELLHNKLPDLSFLHVFGALCYPTNDSENLGKLQPKADIGIFIGYAPTKKAFWIYNRRTRRIVKTIHLFDELLTPLPSVDPPAPKVIAPIADVIPPVQAESTGSPSSTTVDQDAPSPTPKPAASTGSPSSTIIDQDAPSPSNSQTLPETL
nr:hypothetical protein [Tanacetum cinerariifolium]